ncbi:MAG: alpha-glucan family phosphorylase, partial [Deltaproteobacteria bacterium]|nr:alpha-glucan family phosphorylase [Deltaproteobacteria bacterium]
YFSTEYGLHESLPIYSGGLGVLSGDHLKSASDLNIPLVAVGLLYRNGYFRQQIDKDARQIPIYPENNFAELPIQRVQEAGGSPIYMQIELPGRQLFFQIWKVAVGRITLYLMDTDIPMNTPDDRKITARLYEADRDYRLRQEILLGMGGVRMLARLGIHPSAYHMNEGHSAFMVLERIRTSMSASGLNLHGAMEVVRSNTIFTTHTPVDAGNERFTEDLIARYFRDYAESIGLSFQDFMRLGRLKGDERHVFEMTVLALRMSFRANGVSRLHGLVSRYMWREAWKGVPVSEIPIGYVTNGIHVPSYVGDRVRSLLERELGANWLSLPPGAPQWEQVDRITNEEFWRARQEQKEVLLQYIRDRLPSYIRKFNIPRENQKKMMNGLTSSALVIGFARRFAPYKRATLLFADPDRLARILNDPNRPIILVFSGKAHPADEEGIKLIQTVIGYCSDPRFSGHIFFIEDYSLAVSRLMVQGSDIWLNTPRRPYEASGTSGQKVPVNGGLNLSISDGWWCEGQGAKNGWTIGPLVTDELPSSLQSDYSDAESLYSLLEDAVMPLYYDRRDSPDIPHRWLEYAKQSVKTLTAQFSSGRMVSDYLDKYYLPASIRFNEMSKDELHLAKNLAAWQADVATRFSSLRLGNIQVNGMNDDQLICGQPLTVQLNINLGAMQANEILAQLVIGPMRGEDFADAPTSVRLTPDQSAKDSGEVSFTGAFTATRNGRYAYGIRVMPVMPGLDNPLSTGLLLWA